MVSELSSREARTIIDKRCDIDLPILVRATYANNVSAVDLESPMPGHVDIPRLRKGRVGGFFWCVLLSWFPDNANIAS